MLTLTHALVAGLIAQRSGDAASGVLLSLVSHYLLDAVPHWDVGTDLRSRPAWVTGLLSIGETLLGLAATFAVFWKSVPLDLLSLCVIVSVLPDWIQIPGYVVYGGKYKEKPAGDASLTERSIYAVYKFGSRFHAKANIGLGLATQAVTIVFFYLLLK
jgi:hypothetical protein